MSRFRHRATVGLASVLFIAVPLPTGPQPTEWPIERIIANLNERLRVAPDDGRALYNLGRAHAFAFALEGPSLWATDDRPRLANPARSSGVEVLDLDEQRRYLQQSLPATVQRANVDARAQLDHLARGVANLRRSCALEEKDVWWRTRKHLTFAWLLETGAHLAEQLDTGDLLELEGVDFAEHERLRTWIVDLGSEDDARAQKAQSALMTAPNLQRAVPLLDLERSSSNARRQRAVAALLERYWIERAIVEYWNTFELGFADLLAEGVSIRLGKGLESLVAHEALAAYRRLVHERGIQGPEEEKRLARAEELWSHVEAMPRSGWVTPLLVSLVGCKTLDELVARETAVAFDLDGDCVDELWPWLAPGAGWLVWDPERRGEITSGRQLFGTASAWLFFEDGYRVLDALDDDRDGALRAAELAGIAVWFDRDTDGISDRGEVVPVEELGIAALATEATLRIGASPANLCGIEMEDGRVLPSYDWVLASVTESAREPTNAP